MERQELDGNAKEYGAGGVILLVRHVTSVEPMCSHKRRVASLSAVFEFLLSNCAYPSESSP